MDSLVTHPIFGYRISYRRILEVQARLLARVLLANCQPIRASAPARVGVFKKPAPCEAFIWYAMTSATRNGCARTYKEMLGFGDPLQYSVFRCELAPPRNNSSRGPLGDPQLGSRSSDAARPGALRRTGRRLCGILGPAPGPTPRSGGRYRVSLVFERSGGVKNPRTSRSSKFQSEHPLRKGTSCHVLVSPHWTTTARKRYPKPSCRKNLQGEHLPRLKRRGPIEAEHTRTHRPQLAGLPR